jgi:hypothetical protein
MTSIVKHAIAAITLLLISGYCEAQKKDEPERFLQIMIPAVLRVSPVPSDIVNWTRQQFL